MFPSYSSFSLLTHFLVVSCVLDKLLTCRLIFQPIYRVKLMATLEDNVESLVVLFLQLPARAATVGYAEHAVHRDPQRGKGRGSYQCLGPSFHVAINVFGHLQYRGQDSSVCLFVCLFCPLKNIPPQFPVDTCTLQIYTYDLTVSHLSSG